MTASCRIVRRFCLCLLFLAIPLASRGSQEWLLSWPTDQWHLPAHVPPRGLGNVAAVSVGVDFALALRSNGTVVAWGNIDPVPAGLANVVAVSAGGLHAVALKNDGTVVAWGYNGLHQTDVPAGLNSVVAISAGGQHTLALRANGTVAGWGDNTYGQATVPAGLTGIVAVAAGEFHSMVLRSDGTVYAWGDPYDGVTNPPAGLNNVIAIAAAGHSMALRSDGTVAAWGYNYNGQTSVPAGLNNVTAIAAGGNCSIALRADGSAVLWGGNNFAPPGSGLFRYIAAGGREAIGLTQQPVSRRDRTFTRLDFDGDGADDLALFDPATGNWYIRRSSDGQMLGGAPINWGNGSMSPVPADYDGDGRADIAVYESTTGNWFIRQSSDGQLQGGAARNWGWFGVVPVPEDYDGDGRADLAVFNPDGSTWYVQNSSDGQLRDGGPLRVSSGAPVPGDYDGDGRGDLAVWESGIHELTVSFSLSHAQVTEYLLDYGILYDAPVAVDMDGQAAMGLAQYFWRLSWYYVDIFARPIRAGTWAVATDDPVLPNVGSSRAWPVPADYNGDGRTDLTAFTPSRQEWKIRQSHDGQVINLKWPNIRGLKSLVPVENQLRINRTFGLEP